MRLGKIILSVILIISLLSPILVTSCGGGGTGPELNDIRAPYVYPTRAKVQWLTDVNSISQVDYGTTDSYGSTTDPSETQKTIHQVWLEDLEPSTTYHYRVRSTAGGKETVSGDYTFTTQDAP